MSNRRIMDFVAIVPLCASLALGLAGGCDATSKTPYKNTSGQSQAKGTHDDHDDAHDGHGHHHAETGPHGGALAAIGEDDAHLELVLDSETGKLVAYVLDGKAEKAVTINQATLELGFTLEVAEGDDQAALPDMRTLTLAAVKPGADGAASEFAGQSDDLKGAKEFDAAITTITIGGKEFPGVTFNYPHGNEHDH